MPETWMYVIGAVLTAMLVFTIGSHLLSLSINQAQEQDFLSDFNDLYSNIESVCSQEIGNSVLTKLRIPTSVRVVYATDDTEDLLPTVTDLIENKEISNGISLCFQFKTEQYLRCQNLTCETNIFYMGALESYNDIQIMVNKILGRALVKEHWLLLAKTSMGIEITLGKCRGEGEECSFQLPCCSHNPYCWGNLIDELTCHNTRAPNGKYAADSYSCQSGYLNTFSQCDNPPTTTTATTTSSTTTIPSTKSACDFCAPPPEEVGWSNAIREIYEEAGNAFNVPAPILASIGHHEWRWSQDISVYTDDFVKEYSEPGAALPGPDLDDRLNPLKCPAGAPIPGMPWGYRAKGIMQFMPDQWDTYKYAVRKAKDRPTDYEPNICNIKDAIFAAAAKLRHDVETIDSVFCTCAITKLDPNEFLPAPVNKKTSEVLDFSSSLRCADVAPKDCEWKQADVLHANCHYSQDEYWRYWPTTYWHYTNYRCKEKETIETIAKQALGHPYCLGAGEWDVTSPPPSAPCSAPACGITVGKCPTDCSAFTKWVFNRYAYLNGLPQIISVRTAQWQGKNVGSVVDGTPQCGDSCSATIPNLGLLKSGDLVFFCGTYDVNGNGVVSCFDDGVSHVGIYLGNKEFIEASWPGGVIISDLSKTTKYVGARHV